MGVRAQPRPLNYPISNGGRATKPLLSPGLTVDQGGFIQSGHRVVLLQGQREPIGVGQFQHAPAIQPPPGKADGLQQHGRAGADADIRTTPPQRQDTELPRLAPIDQPQAVRIGQDDRRIDPFRDRDQLIGPCPLDITRFDIEHLLGKQSEGPGTLLLSNQHAVALLRGQQAMTNQQVTESWDHRNWPFPHLFAHLETARSPGRSLRPSAVADCGPTSDASASRETGSHWPQPTITRECRSAKPLAAAFSDGQRRMPWARGAGQDPVDCPHVIAHAP